VVMFNIHRLSTVAVSKSTSFVVSTEGENGGIAYAGVFCWGYAGQLELAEEDLIYIHVGTPLVGHWPFVNTPHRIDPGLFLFDDSTLDTIRTISTTTIFTVCPSESNRIWVFGFFDYLRICRRTEHSMCRYYGTLMPNNNVPMQNSQKQVQANLQIVGGARIVSVVANISGTMLLADKGLLYMWYGFQTVLFNPIHQLLQNTAGPGGNNFPPP